VSPSEHTITPAALKLKDAAAYLGVSPATVRRLIDRGEIRSVQALRHILISIKELDRFLEETNEPAEDDAG
jgi:excisionase family DNA binding protein